LPVRIRTIDPAGRVVDETFRATAAMPDEYAEAGADNLGGNAAPGEWVFALQDLASGKEQTVTRSAPLQSRYPKPGADCDLGRVSIYFDDAKKIADLFAGKADQPPYDKLNWDAKRVWGLDPKKFAVFGPDEAAKTIAQALKAKGMAVEVNPKYEIKQFVREEGRGGAGPVFGLDNFENIYAHAIVLPGHQLLKQSWERGCVNREVTATFPGPGRAYVQWGIGCYQAGWQDVFVEGDLDAGVAWLLDAIKGKVDAKTVALTANIKTVKAEKADLPAKFVVGREVKTYDTPVGVGASPDGQTTYVLLYDGSVTAYDADGKEKWHRPALLEGGNLAVSPKGDRVAVAGYPGLLVLDAKDGKVLGGHRAPPVEKGPAPPPDRMLAVAWNDKGTLVASAWSQPDPKAPAPAVVLDADGKEVSRPKVAGGVFGAAFAPGGDVLLLGGDQLAAVDAKDGKPLWTNPVKGAQAFAFSADGKTAAAGGWGKNTAVFAIADGKPTKQAAFDSVVGGVALLPGGDLAVAVWGGVHPLYVLRGDGAKPETLFQSRFGFQNVVWSDAHKGLVAAEEGGRLWLLDADGKPKAMLGEDAGTTAYRLAVQGGDVLVGRMSRSVQRLAVK
jgi:hypothetical protein